MVWSTEKHSSENPRWGDLNAPLSCANPAGPGQCRPFGAVQRRGCLQCGWGNPHALGHWCKASEAMLLQPSMSAWATFDDNVQRAGPDGAKALLPLAGASLQWISACRRAASHPPRRRPRPGMAGTRQLTGRPVCLSRSELVDHSISQHDPHILMIVSTSSLGCMPSPTPFKLDTRAL